MKRSSGLEIQRDLDGCGGLRSKGFLVSRDTVLMHRSQGLEFERSRGLEIQAGLGIQKEDVWRSGSRGLEPTKLKFSRSRA